MSANEEIPARLREMKAEIELLQYVVVFLCTAAIPSDALGRLIERLDTPVAGDDIETTQAMHNVIGRFINKLEETRTVTKD